LVGNFGRMVAALSASIFGKLACQRYQCLVLELLGEEDWLGLLDFLQTQKNSENTVRPIGKFAVGKKYELRSLDDFSGCRTQWESFSKNCQWRMEFIGDAKNMEQMVGICAKLEKPAVTKKIGNCSSGWYSDRHSWNSNYVWRCRV